MKKRLMGILISVVMILAMASVMSFAETQPISASEDKILLVKSNAVKKTAVELTWNEISDATKYVVYGSHCGEDYKKLKTVTKRNITIKKIKGKKLQAHKTYKFYVVAYNGSKKLCMSKPAKCITASTSGKYGNVKTIKTDITELNLEKGDTFQIKITKTIKSAKKHLPKKYGVATRYYSTDKAVAEVDEAGLIKTNRAGSATIYAQDIGGKYVAISVTVAGRPVGAVLAGSSNAGPLCFTYDKYDLSNGGTIAMEGLGEQVSTKLLYSFNGSTWEPFVIDETKVPINRSHPTVYFKAAQPNKTAGGSFVIDADSVYASGNVMTLLDPTGKSVTIEEEQAFSSLFWGCSALKTAPKLPAVNLSRYCYSQMFRGCTGLITMPELPATKMADFCYMAMFKDCGFLVGVKLPSTELATSCYSYMFNGCDGVSFETDYGEVLPASKLADACYAYMFAECNKVENGPEKLSVTVLPESCYAGMYMGCPDVVTPPQMTVVSIGESSCKYMFKDCTNLKNAGNIRMGVMLGIGMASESCKAMFEGCSSLTVTPNITIATTDESCCEDMYKDCTKLVTVAHNMGITTTPYCYKGMFTGCTSLKNAPTLGAVKLADYCYADMYNGCTALTAAAPMEAAELAPGCCARMYMGCTSLTSVPELKAESLVHKCYERMFENCSKLNSLRVRIRVEERSDLYCADRWLENTAETGAIYCPSEMSNEYIPEGWKRINIY